MIDKFFETYTQVRLSELFKAKPQTKYLLDQRLLLRNFEWLLGLLYVTNINEIQLSFLHSTQDFQKISSLFGYKIDPHIFFAKKS